MAPPHLKTKTNDSYNARYENNRDIAVLADVGWGYRKITQHMGMPVSTVAGVVKRYRERGSASVHDAPRSGRRTKISSFVQHQVESLVEENPRASLSEITEGLQSVGLDIGRSTVDKVTKGLGFKLKVPRKKPFLDNFQKVRHRYVQILYLNLRLSISIS